MGIVFVPGVIPTPASALSTIGPYISTATNGTYAPLLNQSGTLGYTKVVNPRMVIASHRRTLCGGASILRRWARPIRAPAPLECLVSILTRGRVVFQPSRFPVFRYLEIIPATPKPVQ